MRIGFVKMQGLGNDFVLIDDLDRTDGERSPVDSAVARALCDRRFGIGADQLIWLLPSKRADVLVRFYNADGSEAEMCGNGIRAVGVYLASSGPRPDAEKYVAETAAGPQMLEFEAGAVKVSMGAPRVLRGFDPPKGHPVRVAGRDVRVYDVSVGNPHAVIFVDEVEECDAEKIGPELERHADYPQRTNVEFVEVLGPQSIGVRVWERGAGFTLACGTGASAAAVAAIATGRVSSPVDVELPGGNLQISWAGGDSPVVMVGPAAEVFRGEVDLGALLASGIGHGNG